MTTPNKPQIGIYYMLFASVCIATAGAFSKVMSQRLSAMEIVFFRNIFGVLYVLWLVFSTPLVQQGGRGGLLFVRGFLGGLAILANFYAIIKIGLAEAITYQQSYPIFLLVISAFILKKSIKTVEWIAILLGFAGICLIFFPQFKLDGDNVLAHSIGIFYAIIAAIAYLSIAELSKFYENRIIVLVFMSVGVITPLGMMVIGYFFQLKEPAFLFAPPIMPRGNEWFLIAALGITALLGQINITKAFTLGKASEVSAIGYSKILFSILLGQFIGESLPNQTSFVGIFLIIICGVLIAFNKKG
jgi:drug/metabolite transporter (DMT)-like permease